MCKVLSVKDITCKKWPFLLREFPQVVAALSNTYCVTVGHSDLYWFNRKISTTHKHAQVLWHLSQFPQQQSMEINMNFKIKVFNCLHGTLFVSIYKYSVFEDCNILSRDVVLFYDVSLLHYYSVKLWLLFLPIYNHP